MRTYTGLDLRFPLSNPPPPPANLSAASICNFPSSYVPLPTPPPPPSLPLPLAITGAKSGNILIYVSVIDNSNLSNRPF